MMRASFPISESVLAAVGLMDRLRGAWGAEAALPPDRLVRLEEAARIQSVAASCRLSGIRLSDREVAGILSERGVPLRDSPAILGYEAALKFPLPNDELLSTQLVQRLHAVLLGGDPSKPTPWRTGGAYHREAFDAEGRAMGRVFTALPSHLVEEKLEDVLTWLEFELRSGERHPVPVIGVFALALHAISPFDRANSRLARVLTPLLLVRAGYAYVPCASIESHIEDLRSSYHESFDLSQTHFWNGEADLGPWLDFFLQVLSRHRERVEVKLTLERDAAAFPPLQQTILETIREHGSVNAGLLLRATGANRNTLKDNLRRLVERGALEKTGQRRGTRYRLAILDHAKS